MLAQRLTPHRRRPTPPHPTTHTPISATSQHGKLRPHYELLTHAVEMKDIGRVGLLHREDTIKGISAIVKPAVRKASGNVGKKHGTLQDRYGFGKK